MKRLPFRPGDARKETAPVRLHFDDLEVLEDLLPDEDSFEVETLGYRFESLEELQVNARERKVSSLKLDSRDLQIEMESWGCEIRGASSLVIPATHFLRSKVPLGSRLVLPRFGRMVLRGVLAFVSLVGSVIYLTVWLAGDPPPVWIVLLFLLFAVLAWSPLFGSRPVFGGTRIILESSLKDAPFWEKHGGDIKKNAVSALVGALIGTVLGYLIGQW